MQYPHYSWLSFHAGGSILNRFPYSSMNRARSGLFRSELPLTRKSGPLDADTDKKALTRYLERALRETRSVSQRRHAALGPSWSYATALRANKLFGRRALDFERSRNIFTVVDAIRHQPCESAQTQLHRCRNNRLCPFRRFRQVRRTGDFPMFHMQHESRSRCLSGTRIGLRTVVIRSKPG